MCMCTCTVGDVHVCVCMCRVSACAEVEGGLRVAVEADGPLVARPVLEALHRHAVDRHVVVARLAGERALELVRLANIWTRAWVRVRLAMPRACLSIAWRLCDYACARARVCVDAVGMPGAWPGGGGLSPLDGTLSETDSPSPPPSTRPADFSALDEGETPLPSTRPADFSRCNGTSAVCVDARDTKESSPSASDMSRRCIDTSAGSRADPAPASSAMINTA